VNVYEELLPAGVSAARDQRDALSGQLIAHSQSGRERRRTGRLDEVACRLDHQPLSGADLVVGHQHEVVEPLAQDALRQLEGRPRREALGERPHPVLDEPPLAPGPVCSRRRVGLDADHLGVGLHGLGDDARARRAAAAADRDDDHVDPGLLLEDLERLGRHSGDQQRLVAGMHVAVPALVREPLAVLAGIVEVMSMEDELRAEGTHRGDLDRVRRVGDADRRRHAEEAGRKGDRLAVVARRRGDDAALPILGAQLRDEVDPAADLEGADGLMVLVLHEDFGAEQLAERGVLVQRRRAQVGGDTATRLEHVCERGDL
jgi:hypothetical protein